MASREDEAIPVDPQRVGRVVSHHPRVQGVGDGGEPHRRPGMPRVRFLHGVHRERADRVHAQLVEREAIAGRRQGRVR